MIHIAGLAKTHKAGIKMAKNALKDGSALEKFVDLLKGQGGDTSFVEDYSKFKLATQRTEVFSMKSGYIHFMDTKKIGLHCVKLGGGRLVKEDIVDPSVGFVFHKKIGDKVKVGDSILTIYHHESQNKLAQNIQKELAQQDIKVKPKVPVKKRPLIYETSVKWSHN